MSELFEGADLSGAVFREVDLSDARFERASFQRVVMRGVELVDVTIDGDIEGLVINGVEVAPLIVAELDRQNPDRVKMRPTDPQGFREARELVEQLWKETVARARQLPPELHHENVDGEWSFVQTLRHLNFAIDAWVNRVIRGNPHPWHELDLPFDGMPDIQGIPRDRDAKPSLDEILTVRADRQASLREVIDNLTEEQLASSTEPVEEPAWPRSESFSVKEVLHLLLNEEWQHRLYAERDLAALEARVDHHEARESR
ncbi:DinB family protein [Tenggerimyces flavus]|uniref:DinB family protein n=1 Tax=Tenggerimyces flavus TaxID=1708749 RepID=A0ABV7YNS7_9ACTN|nr:DinB family protein [Tenggerimyces flavus]MBM7789504.1 putative damage-inducible protein DinB [Tenggerimyces flavus]